MLLSPLPLFRSQAARNGTQTQEPLLTLHNTNGLQSVSPYEGTDTLMVADGTFVPFTHTGSTTLTSPSGTIPLSEVLVCPAIQKSLLPVSKLCDDYSCGVFFYAKKVCVIDLTTQKVVSKGNMRNGLYMLESPGDVSSQIVSRQLRTVCGITVLDMPIQGFSNNYKTARKS